jgi:transcriptional regulator with XRE-family HTH domain
VAGAKRLKTPMKNPLPILREDPEEIRQQLSFFGARLRELRLQQGLTLQEVAERSGFSKAFLSRLESGGRQASISAALTLCRIFRVSLSSLFEKAVEDSPCTIIRAAEAVEKSAKGLKYAPLSDAARMFNVQPMRVKVSPQRRGDEHYHHEGEEWIYVLRGRLTLSIAGSTYDLEEGDAAHFESRLPHRLIARSGREAEVLVVAAPRWGASPPALSRERRSIPARKVLPLPSK